MAAADLQPVLEKGKRKSRDLEKAPEVRDARFAQLGVCAAEHAGEPGAVRMAGYCDTRIQGRSLGASGAGH